VKVFVAGGTGVIGRAAVGALREAGHQVLTTARREENARWARGLGAEPVTVDLDDPTGVRRMLPQIGRGANYLSSIYVASQTVDFGRPPIGPRRLRAWPKGGHASRPRGARYDSSTSVGPALTARPATS
jgi:uncharacterized protein YbjT (DUF2867 family)